VRHSASVKIWRTAVPSQKSLVVWVPRLGTHRGRKIADCNGTQPNATARKSLINTNFLRSKRVPFNPVEYG